MSNVKDFPPPKPSRGRPFAAGNPGRKPGSRNKVTLVVEALLKDEEGEITRTGIELAKSGDGPMLRFFLDRVLPKERTVHFDLPPMDGAADAVRVSEAILSAVANGQITPSEAAALANVVAVYARTIDAERLDNIEKELSALNRAKP